MPSWFTQFLALGSDDAVAYDIVCSIDMLTIHGRHRARPESQYLHVNHLRDRETCLVLGLARLLKII
jgi:hypothetical protein